MSSDLVDNRTDVRELAGAGAGKVAVVVCGGGSGGRWGDVVGELGGRGQVVLVGVNGSVAGLGLGQGLGEGDRGERFDYWLGLEIDDAAKCRWMPWNLPGFWDRVDTAIINRQTPKIYARLKGIDWDRFIVAARNQAHNGEEDPRKINVGLHVGPHGGVDAPLGGAVLPAMHFCGVLGCSEAHTIGVDMCFRSDDAHHWYADGLYTPQRQDVAPKVASPHMEYAGLKTNRWFVRSAEYLVRVRRDWWKQGFRWYDHSDGLLQRTPGWDDVEN